jgi:hypothetical protein
MTGLSGRGVELLDRLPVDEAQLLFLARRVHALGDRPLFELLKEIVAGADPIARLERYAALDPAILAYLGGDRLRQEAAS